MRAVVNILQQSSTLNLQCFYLCTLYVIIVRTIAHICVHSDRALEHFEAEQFLRGERPSAMPWLLLLAIAYLVRGDFVYRDFNETDGIHVRLNFRSLQIIELFANYNSCSLPLKWHSLTVLREPQAAGMIR